MFVHHVSYKHHQQASYFFKDLSFEIELGKMHALHGKNGMGKSVLMNILSGKNSPHSIIEGEITRRENVTLVNQRFDHMIADQFSFEENLKFACMHPFPKIFSRLKTPYIDLDFIEKFHIDMSQPVYKLSGGQRQILALLMVLQRKVNILLLDEPTATLDEHNAEMVFEFLKTLTKQNITLLIVCHDRDLVKRYANGQHLYLEMADNGMRRLRLESALL